MTTYWPIFKILRSIKKYLTRIVGTRPASFIYKGIIVDTTEDDKDKKPSQPTLKEKFEKKAKKKQQETDETSHNISQVKDNFEKYKAPAFGGVALILIAIGVFTFMRSARHDLIQDFDESYVQFNKNEAEKFSTDKIEAAAFIAKAEEILSEFEGKDFTATLVIEVAQSLNDKEKYQEALDFLSRNKKTIDSFNNTTKFFASYLMANSYEDLGKVEEASSILESLVNSNLMLDKVYFDLGRMYKKLGNQEKATTSFQWVIDNYPDSDFANFAKALM